MKLLAGQILGLRGAAATALLLGLIAHDDLGMSQARSVPERSFSISHQTLEPLGRPVVLHPPFHLSKLVTKPRALAVGTLECGLKSGLLNLEP